MDDSSRKRRRVLPHAAAPDQEKTASETPGPPRKRPSFASPTKSSLARHHPQILDRRRSASPAKPDGAQSATRRVSNAGNGQIKSGLLAVPHVATAEDVAASEADREEHETREAQGSDRTSRPARAGPSAKPNPRPLPPPAPEGEDELNPFIGHTLRRSPNTGISIPAPPEPELPPSVPDPVSSTPPRGIHTSPSRWRGRPKVKKSSPLKAPPARPGQEPAEKAPEPVKKAPEPAKKAPEPAKKAPGPFKKTPEPAKKAPEPVKKSTVAPPEPHRGAGRREQPPRDVTLDTTTNKARQVAALNPNADKLKERDELRAEIASLKSDLRMAGAENERLRLMEASGRIVSSTDEDGVNDLLRRHLASPGGPPRPVLSQQLTQAILNPMGFLPFGRPLLAAPPATDDGLDLENIKSHHPVMMTADEELPYLQLFSPFSVTSSVSVLSSKPGRPMRQRRLVTLRSRDVPGLFTTKLEMTVNATNLSITDLAVTSLEPSARFELQPFIDKICSGSCNRTMQRNVGILSWAMGEWYLAAIQRAVFWMRLDRNLGSQDRVLKTVVDMREGRQRKQQEHEDGAEVETEPSAETQDACDTADLMRFLGQQSFEIQVPAGRVTDGGESSLRLEWKIGFDWTGEAQSKITMLVGVPGKWREADGRGVLGKVPKLFEDLVAGGQDAEAAVRTMTALLAGTDDLRCET